MTAIDRVMQAYLSKHDLNTNQAAFVRGELSKIIAVFMAEARRPDGVREGTGCTEPKSAVPAPRPWSAREVF